MSTYNEMFKLTFKNVDLIERAQRQQIGHLSRLEASPRHKEPEAVENHKKIIEITPVGKKACIIIKKPGTVRNIIRVFR